MTPEVVAALLGAGLAGLAALVVQITGAWTARSAGKKADRATRLAEYLAATHSAVLAITRLALLESGDGVGEKGGYRFGAEYRGREDRVNNIFNAIQLLDPESVVEAAIELDLCLVALEREAIEQCWDWNDWDLRRTKLLSNSVDRLMMAGRTSLGRGSLHRERLFASARNTLDGRGKTASDSSSTPGF